MAEGRKFGQEQPPLSVYLKRILERYPGGQIFKVRLLYVAATMNAHRIREVQRTVGETVRRTHTSDVNRTRVLLHVKIAVRLNYRVMRSVYLTGGYSYI